MLVSAILGDEIPNDRSSRSFLNPIVNIKSPERNRCQANLPTHKKTKVPGKCQWLDLFIKVISVLCCNLTDASREMVKR